MDAVSCQKFCHAWTFFSKYSNFIKFADDIGRIGHIYICHSAVAVITIRSSIGQPALSCSNVLLLRSRMKSDLSSVSLPSGTKNVKWGCIDAGTKLEVG